MIALLNGTPLLIKRSGRLCSFRKSWLRGALYKASFHAGYRDWAPATDVTEIINTYLKTFYEPNVIRVRGLESLVRRTLCDLGYEDVARFFGEEAPRDQLYLKLST